MELLNISSLDNIAVALRDLKEGEKVRSKDIEIVLRENVPSGHKVAIKDISVDDYIIKYGSSIGRATTAISVGQWVHTQNIKTNLGGILSYEYQPSLNKLKVPDKDLTFEGYRRTNGRVGIRNEIWIIPTVSCVNRIAEIIAKESWESLKDVPNLEGVFEFKHPYGCSQMGDDQLATQQLLANLVNHPNAGGVLVLGLGCENSNIEEIKKHLGAIDAKRVRFLVAQDVEDEVGAGIELIKDLAETVREFRREVCSVSELTVGLKCGGSDGFSGITANPLVGRFSDQLITQGGSTVLTEVPEMFGAETYLMNRARTQEVFTKIVALINDFKDYYAAHEQPIYENPSPGNKQGGITTLEDKSLGCIQKGGTSDVVDVLAYTERAQIKGLNLLYAPGNDMVAATALAASGCQLILFTTGRGTPLGTCVPTLKIATNTRLFENKSRWMDFDAGKLLSGVSMEDLADTLWDEVLNVASGKLTKSETMGFRDIAIFKRGVTL